MHLISASSSQNMLFRSLTARLRTARILPGLIGAACHVITGPSLHLMRVMAYSIFHAVVAGVAARRVAAIVRGAGKVLVARRDEVEADRVAGQVAGG